MTRLAFIFLWSRKRKKIFSASVDIIILGAASYLAMFFRVQTIAPFLEPAGFMAVFTAVVAGILLMQLLGVYSTVLRFSGVTMLQTIGMVTILQRQYWL